MPLIEIIERFGLSTLDKHESLPQHDFTLVDKMPLDLGLRPVYRFHPIRFIISQKGDSFGKIAQQFGLKIDKLYEYNECQLGEELKEGQKIYLEPKTDNAVEAIHVVQKGENLYSIAQLHGIKLAALCQKNYLRMNESLHAGEILFLIGTRPSRLPQAYSFKTRSKLES